MVRRHCEHGAEAAVGGQRAQQAVQRLAVEAQRGAVAYVAREASLDGAQHRRAREDDDGVPHR